MKTTPNVNDPWQAIKQLAADLRDPEGGCPWDLEQTHESLKKHLIEEAYEVVQAIEQLEASTATYTDLKEELGDLLFQVVIHSQLAAEQNAFNLDEVAAFVTEKLVNRHPHVYETENALKSTGDVLNQWEEIKAKERLQKEHKTAANGVLDGIPPQLPALLTAFRMGEKIENKFGELPYKWQPQKPALEGTSSGEKDDYDSERAFGQLFFRLCQWARAEGLDPEAALRRANQEFKNEVENQVHS